jgi:hypothetical protein
MITKRLVGQLLVIWCVGIPSSLLAYEIETHALISGQAAFKSIMEHVLNRYLLVDGRLDDDLGGLPRVGWVRRGAEREDLVPRFLNHFHNPLEPWTVAGYSQFGQSSILWGQNPDQGWSWADARQFLYESITRPTPAERQTMLARMLRALGHLVHLVQDAASPAHTRDDGHVFYNYEALVRHLHTGTEPAFVARYLADASRRPPPEWRTFAPDPLAPLPVARLLDTDRYLADGGRTGLNPDVTAEPLIGLAEYTNANFLSEDTLWRDRSFRHPAPESTIEVDYDITLPSGERVRRRYHQKVAGGDVEPVAAAQAQGLPGYRLATVGFLKDYYSRYNVPVLRARHTGALDDLVYQDYAEKLLPRALAYSVALLDEFFEGATRTVVTQAPSFDPANPAANSLIVFLNESDHPVSGVVELYHERWPSLARQLIGQWPVALPAGASTEPLQFPLLPSQLNEQFAACYVVFRGDAGPYRDVVTASWGSCLFADPPDAPPPSCTGSCDGAASG